MEATIQQNGKAEEPLPVFTNGSMENKDQLTNTLEIAGEPNLSQQSALITSGGTPSSTWKSVNSVQATTNNLKHLLTMDEVVRHSLINDNWKIVESRKSHMVSTLPKYSVRSLVPPFLAEHDRISETRLSTTSTVISTSGQVHGYQEQNMGQHNGNHLSHSTGADFNYNGKFGEADFQTNATRVKSTSLETEISQAKVPQNYHFGAAEAKKSRQVSNRQTSSGQMSSGQMSFNSSLDDNEDDDDDLFSITMRKKRHVPLPAFGDDDDDGEENNSGEEEVPYASQWSMKDRGSLSFYDNLMDLDIKKPLYMLVPHSQENSTPRVGELELDQLSDLSENEANSDEIPLSDTDDDLSRRNNPRKLSRIDSSMQTDEPFPASRMREAGTMTAADIIAEIEAERSGNAGQGTFIPLLTKSTEGDEVDPKFTKRPATYFEVLEGEALSITCQLNGQEPIDVFWFRDMEEVTQLEEDNRCDISHFGDMFTLTLFDTTKKDGGQYLCIGVNSQGHCVQGFQVNIQGNKNQGIPPSFLAGLVNTEAFKEDKATFGCKVSGYPPPRVLWYHKGERCKDGRKYKIVNDGSGGHKLVVRDVDETNTSYSAVARNVNGEVSSTAEVHIKEKDLENTKTASVSSVTSPYPDVDELVQIAQKVSSTHTEITPSRTKSRFSFTVDKAFDESALKHERDKIHNDTNFKDQTPQFKVCREKDEVFLQLPEKNTNLSDDEQELNVSYQEFERLFEARLISRSQLNSGRVWKKDLEKIQAFLKQISADNKKPQETETSEDVQLRVNCGLKSVNPSFYRRDYVINMDSARHNVNSESQHQENQQMAGRIQRPNSVISNSTAKSVKVTSTGLDSISFQDKKEDLNRSQILNAAKKSDASLRRSESVDRNSEGDHQQMAGRIQRPNSVISNSTTKSVKVTSTGLDSISFQDKKEDLSQIMNAAKKSDASLRRPESVDRNSEGDHDRSVDEKFVMPCVKELLSKFGAPLSPETPGPVDEVSPLKRIYSLTGRSIPEFVRERIQRQVSSSLTVDKMGKGNNKNTSEDYIKYSLPVQHSTYVDGAPITVESTNVHEHVKAETITNRQVSNHSATSSIKQDNININVRELRPGQLQSSHTLPGRKSRSVETPVSDSQQRDFNGVPSQSKPRGGDTVVRRRAEYWLKFISEQHKPEKYPKMSYDSSNSGDD